MTWMVPDVGEHGSGRSVRNGIDLDGCYRMRLHARSTIRSPASDSTTPSASSDAGPIGALLHLLIVSDSLNRCRFMNTSSFY